MGEQLVYNYLQDILLPSEEIEQIKKDAKDIEGFKKNFYYKRTSERSFLIIGENVKKLATLKPELLIQIRNRENSVGL